MLPALLGTAVGAAAVTIGRGTLTALGNGLSFSAELAKAASSPLTADAPPQESASQKPSELTQRISAFTERLRRCLAAAGIKLTESAELISGELGGIAVAGNHPQRAAIEQAIGNDVLLERDFARLAADDREQNADRGEGNTLSAFAITVPAAP